MRSSRTVFVATIVAVAVVTVAVVATMTSNYRGAITKKPERNHHTVELSPYESSIDLPIKIGLSTVRSLVRSFLNDTLPIEFNGEQKKRIKLLPYDLLTSSIIYKWHGKISQNVNDKIKISGKNGDIRMEIPLDFKVRAFAEKKKSE